MAFFTPSPQQTTVRRVVSFCFSVLIPVKLQNLVDNNTQLFVSDDTSRRLTSGNNAGSRLNKSFSINFSSEHLFTDTHLTLRLNEPTYVSSTFLIHTTLILSRGACTPVYGLAVVVFGGSSADLSSAACARKRSLRNPSSLVSILIFSSNNSFSVFS